VSDDLVAFLRARLDEDEREAEYALEKLSACTGVHVSDPDDGGDIGHMVAYLRHNPPRALREVEAKRRIVDDYRISVNACRHITGSELDSPGYKSMCGGRDAFRAACIALAAVYSDHPDCRQEWKP
jgi:Family of unknown function (DUF6221)